MTLYGLGMDSGYRMGDSRRSYSRYVATNSQHECRLYSSEYASLLGRTVVQINLRTPHSLGGSSMSGRRRGYSSTNCERKLLTYSSILNSLGEIPTTRLRTPGWSIRSLPLDIVVCFTRIFLPFTGLRSSACSAFTRKSVRSACLSTSQKVSALATWVDNPSVREPTCCVYSVWSGEMTAMRLSLKGSSQSISIHSAVFTSRGASRSGSRDDDTLPSPSTSSPPALDIARSRE
mmetsp:Transcript_10318/g.25336  ORF Transcript_10318/g.25336 Transcript_10318/m.25336 type:complete len:233 (-) Transcript_10318:1773-2471(-)